MTLEMKNHFWAIHGIPNEAKVQIESKIQWAKIILFMLSLNTFAATIIAAANLFMPNWWIVSETDLYWCIIFMAATLLAFLGIVLIIYAHMTAALYWTLHINAQLQILSAYFTTIGDDIQCMNIADIVESLSYQYEITNQLLVAIKHHMELVRYGFTNKTR